MEKTLQQRVREMPDDQMLYIGAAASFFFIGTKAEYEADIDEISDSFLSDAKKRLEKAKKLQSVFPSRLKRLQSFDPGTKDRDTLDTIGLLAKEVSNKALNLRRVLPRVPGLEKYIETYIPLRDRICEEPYERFEDDGLVLIVPGTEMGNYWTREEYLNKTGEEDDDE